MATDKLIKRLLIRISGIIISILPPLVAILSYFPVWVAEGGETVLSGFTALLIILAAMPLYRLLRRALASPSVWCMWLVAFILFLLLSRIADEMTVISLVGLISNLMGALLFRLAKRYEVTP